MSEGLLPSGFPAFQNKSIRLTSNPPMVLNTVLINGFWSALGKELTTVSNAGFPVGMYVYVRHTGFFSHVSSSSRGVSSSCVGMMFVFTKPNIGSGGSSQANRK